MEVYAGIFQAFRYRVVDYWVSDIVEITPYKEQYSTLMGIIQILEDISMALTKDSNVTPELFDFI